MKEREPNQLSCLRSQAGQRLEAAEQTASMKLYGAWQRPDSHFVDAHTLYRTWP